jgi:hypothetical protein
MTVLLYTSPHGYLPDSAVKAEIYRLQKVVNLLEETQRSYRVPRAGLCSEAWNPSESRDHRCGCRLRLHSIVRWECCVLQPRQQRAQ